MKHIFTVFSIACVAFLTILTTNSGCKKGDDGAKGDTGVANMRYSAWLDVPAFAPVKNTAGDTLYFQQTISAPLITDSVINKGDVKIFVNVNTPASPQIISLPLGTALIPIISKGSIMLQGNDDYSTYTVSGAKYWQYRYVILNGTIPARSAVNWNDYQAVKEYLQIPD